jgi:preprotein translocase subunit SecE
MSSLVTYLREVANELKQVTWPSKQQTQEKTALVIAVSIVIGLYLGLLDTIFQKIMTAIL